MTSGLLLLKLLEKSWLLSCLHDSQPELTNGRHYNTLSLLTAAIYKGQRGGRSGSNDRFFEFILYTEGPNYHPSRVLKLLLECVFAGDEVSYNIT